MSALPPLVVAILHSDDEDVDYQLYSQAYGIEMQVDNEWNAEAVLLAPYDSLSSVTENTDVTGEDTAIVSAGVTDIARSADGSFDLSIISDEKNNWLLVGDPRQQEADEIFADKLRAALAADCRAIVCIADLSREQLANRLSALASTDCSKVVIALTHPDAIQASYAAAAASALRDYLASKEASGIPRIIVSGAVTSDNAAEILGIEGVDGFLLMDDQYDDFGTILEILEAVGS